MSDRIDDGGPAFPVQEFHPDGLPATLTLGMTLRDYFAGRALLTLNVMSYGPAAAAMYAYAVADAMLAERAK